MVALDDVSSIVQGFSISHIGRGNTVRDERALFRVLSVDSPFFEVFLYALSEVPDPTASL
jgi:hypothetical protein